jgi:hypothetical protein
MVVDINGSQRNINSCIKVHIVNLCICTYKKCTPVYRDITGRILRYDFRDGSPDMAHSYLGAAVCAITSRKGCDNFSFVKKKLKLMCKNKKIKLTRELTQKLKKEFEFNGNWDEFYNNTHKYKIYVYFDLEKFTKICT